MAQLDTRRFTWQRTVAGGLLLLVLIVTGPRLAHAFFTNLAWVELSKSMFQADVQHARQSLAWLEAGTSISQPTRQDAMVALLAAAAAEQSADTAIDYADILNDADSARLFDVGQTQMDRGAWIPALYLFRNVAEATPVPSYTYNALIHAGFICRRALNPAADPEFSARVSPYCDGYWAARAYNLMLNGQFEHGSLAAWGMRNYQMPITSYSSDPMKGAPPPAAIINGFSAAQPHGLYQQLSLAPGTELHFSAQVKAELEPDSAVRLLHITWQDAATGARGNQLRSVSESTDWVYVERTFQAPANAASPVTFSPALLIGEGRVWIDDVRLTLLTGN